MCKIVANYRRPVSAQLLSNGMRTYLNFSNGARLLNIVADTLTEITCIDIESDMYNLDET